MNTEVNFQDKLCAVLKIASITFDGDDFIATPKDDYTRKVLQLTKNRVKCAKSIEALVDLCFNNLTASCS